MCGCCNSFRTVFAIHTVITSYFLNLLIFFVVTLFRGMTPRTIEADWVFVFGLAVLRSCHVSKFLAMVALNNVNPVFDIVYSQV